jgi:hypothetical protein
MLQRQERKGLLMSDYLERTNKGMKLWRYNAVTGYWNLVRTCDDATATQWLALFVSDEPSASFKLSKRQPK